MPRRRAGAPCPPARPAPDGRRRAAKASTRDLASVGQAACRSRPGARSRSSAPRGRTPAPRARRIRAGRRAAAGRRRCGARRTPPVRRAAGDAPHSSLAGIESTAAHVAGSAARAIQPAPRWRSSSSRIGGAIQVGTWTPLVTCPIGTSARSISGHSHCHISRATSPWRRLTAFDARLIRSASLGHAERGSRGRRA